MRAVRYCFNPISVSTPWQIKNISDGDIPRFVDSVHIYRVQIPEIASIEACSIHCQQFHKGSMVNKVRLFEEEVDFPNESPPLEDTVSLHGVV